VAELTRNITEAAGEQRLQAVAFLQAEGYNGAVQDLDRVFIATVLRGMRVCRSFQRQGVGRALLATLDDVLQGGPCYCVAYRWLLSFYGIIGFREAQPADVPAFLAERYRGYLVRGLDVILMRR